MLRLLCMYGPTVAFGPFSFTPSHHIAPALLTPVQIPFFLLLPQRHPLPSLHSRDLHVRTPLRVPPSQLLDETPIGVVNTDAPLASTHDYLGCVWREVELRQEYLRRRVLRRACFAGQRERKCAVAHVEPVGDVVARRGDGTGPDVSLCGPESRGITEICRCFGHLGGN